MGPERIANAVALLNKGFSATEIMEMEGLDERQMNNVQALVDRGFTQDEIVDMWKQGAEGQQFTQSIVRRKARESLNSRPDVPPITDQHFNVDSLRADPAIQEILSGLPDRRPGQTYGVDDALALDRQTLDVYKALSDHLESTLPEARALRSAVVQARDVNSSIGLEMLDELERQVFFAAIEPTQQLILGDLGMPLNATGLGPESGSYIYERPAREAARLRRERDKKNSNRRISHMAGQIKAARDQDEMMEQRQRAFEREEWGRRIAGSAGAWIARLLGGGS